MNRHYERANHLVDQGRFDMAVAELMTYLSEYPDDAQALSLLAFCQLRLGQFEQATESAHGAIAADPSDGQGFYMLSVIMRERNEPKDAMEAIQTALSLNPAEPGYLVALAHLHFDGKRWEEALAAAQLAAERQPSHLGAINAVATALIRLRRVSEAAQALENALEQAPEDSQTLADMGWLELDRNRYGDALTHFQAALAQEPEMEWAREGLMHALRARYPVYGLVLRYTLWMSKHSHRLQQQITLATYVGARVFGELLKRYPGLAVFAAPLLVVWRLFCYLTWTVRAGSTLLLRMTKYGRALVNRDEVLESNLVGGFWLSALVLWCYHYFIDPFALQGKIGPALFLTLPMVWSATFDCHVGWPRQLSAAISVVMTTAGLLGLLFLSFNLVWAIHCLKFYFYGLGPILLLSQYLVNVEPKK